MNFQVQVNVDLEMPPWMCSIMFTIQMSQEISNVTICPKQRCYQF